MKVSTVQVSFRLDQAVVKRLDEIAAKESKSTGYPVSMTDVARRALAEWLAAHSGK